MQPIWVPLEWIQTPFSVDQEISLEHLDENPLKQRRI